MVQRCHNPNNSGYKNYGGRGITVCSSWRKSVKAFHEDIGDIPEGLQIDRKNNDLGYFKENICFSTQTKNPQNTRKSKWWVINNIRYTSKAYAANILGVSHEKIRAMCNGKTVKGTFYPPKSGCYSALKYPIV